MGQTESTIRVASLVPLVADEDFTPRMREAAGHVIRRAGRVPNSARVLANAGILGAATRHLLEEVWNSAPCRSPSAC